MTIHTLGQVALEFAVSVPQIASAILASALLEVVIAARRSRTIVWPASAMLTGSGVGLIMRVTGTKAGEHWSFHRWWLFALVAAGSLATKYLIRWRGGHVFNPSNLGLVLTFVLLGESRVEPLEFWWHGFGPPMVLVYTVIIGGGLAINRRLHLLELAGAFWFTFAAGIGVLARSGHCVNAPWSFTPVCDGRFWWTVATSPEVLVFMLFMITDPKTVPGGRTSRVTFGVSIAILATLLMAPQQTEFGAKVGLLGALTIVSALRPLVGAIRLPQLSRVGPDQVGTAIGAFAIMGLALFAFGTVRLGERARFPTTAAITIADIPDPAEILARPHDRSLPPVTFESSMSMFGEEYVLPETYSSICEALLYALDVEAEIVRRRDGDLLRAVNHGAATQRADRTNRVGRRRAHCRVGVLVHRIALSADAPQRAGRHARRRASNRHRDRNHLRRERAGHRRGEPTGEPADRVATRRQ